MSLTNLLRREFKYRYFNATLILIGVNVLVFALNALLPVSRVILALIPDLVVNQHWLWQPFSYMFVHANFQHLLFNMLGLFFFGTVVERKIGSNEFLLFYLLTGFLAGLFSLFAFLLMGMGGVPLVGASGAIYAVLFAFAVISPRAMIYIWGIIPVRAPILVLAFTALAIGSQVLGFGGNVAHLTHLAGFGFAALYFPIRHNVNPFRRLLIR
ncbi:MAG: glpG protein [Spirochaetes bacterium GWD1_61_31]|nr:MAG: glpG protein [Spirochaetes bacterium GWB1_60_80]OHD34925.1 MAG: glpG protein [Spirochaetes bacterium GWC1_61_12]OHD37046.1 MAG: glpG protein [Spirochaetes bacterium GWD1_61_31]OHD45344.1 MAG: glpG protein [Spirochaetes bacterium GWE1_60_18]OHD61096.1 MAG: glpG protein [Spirochaetes bacterium GWF1_60_12]HAP42758.1 glpG protein [Spirochaetaceae bacterium]